MVTEIEQAHIQFLFIADFPLIFFPTDLLFHVCTLFFITWKQPNHKDSTHKLHQTASLCPQPTCALQWRIFSTLHFTGYEQTTITFLPWLNINSTKGTMWISILLPFIPLAPACAFFSSICHSFLAYWGPLIRQLPEYWAHGQLMGVWLLYWPSWSLYCLPRFVS